MDRRTTVPVILAACSMAIAPVARAWGGPALPLVRCAPDAVPAGTVCMDRYEATVWRVPAAAGDNARLVRLIQLGRATRANLEAGGAKQLGTVSASFEPCARDGRNCAGDIFAVSLPGETPSVDITWFQAEEACANSAKRLPTNAEWQVGANGTPNPGPDDGVTDCNTTSTGVLSLTGTRSACVSARGAFDMVGNVAEWVADWVPLSTDCPGWGGFSDDEMCLSGASTGAFGPAALVRGGAFTALAGTNAGPLAVRGTVLVNRATNILGFRCVR